jgi:hypothetical protein
MVAIIPIVLQNTNVFANGGSAVSFCRDPFSALPMRGAAASTHWPTS